VSAVWLGPVAGCEQDGLLEGAGEARPQRGEIQEIFRALDRTPSLGGVHGVWFARESQDAKRKGPVVGETTGPSSGYRGVGLWGGEQPLKRIVVFGWWPGAFPPDATTIPEGSRRVESKLAEFLPN